MKTNTKLNWLLSSALVLTIVFGGTWLTQFYQMIHFSHQEIMMEIAAAVLLSIILSTIITLATEAKEVDHMKNEFISVAGHQLRTPITAIRWNGEMLLNSDFGPIGETQKISLQRMHSSAVHMSSLVNDFLNAARIESGRIRLTPKPTNLTELAKKILKNFETAIAEKEIKIKIAFDNLEETNLDPELIGEVFNNLLSNAIKYSPIGGKIDFSIKNIGDNLIVEIKDQGPGIPKAERDKIFSKFFRGKAAILIDTEGNGLGLYIIKAIVESSKGKIWFESEENKGTTFWFSLPKYGMLNK